MSKEIGIKSLDPQNKYRPFSPLKLTNRKWCDNQITKAPVWCSVDLRDGNQALINPMSFNQKLTMFKLLTEIGFKEIEIGFPSAAQVEFDFTRALIEQDLIPDDVTPQILCQARSHLIEKSFEALLGAKQSIFHVYNSTSELQRRVVFKKDKQEIIDIAVKAVEEIKVRSKDSDTKITLEYSPESFTGTEMEFAKEICEAVMNAWEASSKNKMILNLPATVELHTPNIHADQVEWFIENVAAKDAYVLSLHTHNDRGTGVAATELGLLAGADRVEGTLFGNGERTGNVDLITLALNLYTQGIDPGLDLKNLMRIREISEQLTQIQVPERHPYAGDLVFTAFSGSHQDAIKKGMDLHREKKREQNSKLWEVPYIPIDPNDIGRNYEAIIRINSQSGKGGIAYVLENEYGCNLPKRMHPEVGTVIQEVSEKSGQEVPSQVIWENFQSSFVNLNTPIEFQRFSSAPKEDDDAVFECKLQVAINGEQKVIISSGNGPINAAKNALEKELRLNFRLTDFLEHALSQGSDSQAIAYIQIQDLDTEKDFYGVGIDPNIDRASIKALISAINRSGIYEN